MTDSYYIINNLENFVWFHNIIVYVVLGDLGTISLVERNGATKVFKLKQMFALVPLKVILTHECLDQNSSNL